MLKQRLLTAICLLPIVLFLLFTKPVFFVAALIVLLTLAFSEWVHLIPVENKTAQKVLIAFGVIGLILSYWFQLNISTLTLSLCFWAYFTGCICVYPNAADAWNGQLFMCAAMFTLVLGCFQSLYGIRLEYGSSFVLYLLCLIWGADTGAYFAGKAFGKRKLIPNVSPGKTFEGAIGAFVVTLIIATIGHFQLGIKTYIAWYGLSIIILIASIFGDLLISMFKRHVGLKDTGNLLPGHGGVLDRIDSLLSASVFFYFFYKVLI